ncbi:MAG: FAD-binding oxidoreductase, partial [Chloroflexi bacterium]|nr:FAD-binding oxidoreductase [Chloroflexota bacterium]
GAGESNIFIMQWEYRIQPPEPIFPLPVDPEYPELALRGMSRVIPALDVYLNNMPKPYVDGGYYVRTAENRPIVGPLKGVEGAYVLGALSGSGMQLAPAAGELLADHIASAPLPPYAPAFLLERFEDPAYCKLVEEWGATGNL